MERDRATLAATRQDRTAARACVARDRERDLLHYPQWLRVALVAPRISAVANSVYLLSEVATGWRGSEQQWKLNRQALAEADERWAQVATLIEPPVYHANSVEEAELTFFVWTRVLGRVIKIESFFDPVHIFRFVGTEVGVGIGMGTMPR